MELKFLFKGNIPESQKKFLGVSFFCVPPFQSPNFLRKCRWWLSMVHIAHKTSHI